MLADGARHERLDFAYSPQPIAADHLEPGVAGFCLDADGRFIQMIVQIPATTGEFSVNAANNRCWTSKTQSYIRQLLAGAGGKGRNFNMRWNGLSGADAYRIFRRGGIFLYPRDSHKYEDGRLRLVYEANPIALLIEQAGGQASDGTRSILDIVPTGYHVRVPFIFFTVLDGVIM